MKEWGECQLHQGHDHQAEQDEFLSHNANKQQFIELLSSQRRENDCVTHHAAGYADLLIVTTAVEVAQDEKTVVIGEDIYFLVLLCHYANNKANLYFTP